VLLLHVSCFLSLTRATYARLTYRVHVWLVLRRPTPVISDQLAATGFQAAWRGLQGRRRFKRERDKLAAFQLGIDFNEVVTVVRRLQHMQTVPCPASSCLLPLRCLLTAFWRLRFCRKQPLTLSRSKARRLRGLDLETRA